MRENMIIMGDGSFRAVVQCQSINFDLMSAREREGIEFSYQNFINSLYFPVQILVRSRRVDIGPYLDRLGEIRRCVGACWAAYRRLVPRPPATY